MQEHIIAKIKENIKDSKVFVNDMNGGGDHFGLTVVSDEFKGQSVLNQHRMVMAVLSEDLKHNIHAVQINTMTYDRYLTMQTANKENSK